MRADQENNIIARAGTPRIQLQIVLIPQSMFDERLGLKLICYKSGSSGVSRTFLVPISEYSELYESSFYAEVSDEDREIDTCTFCEESDPNIRLQNKEAGFVVHSDCLEDFGNFVKDFLVDSSEIIVKYTV